MRTHIHTLRIHIYNHIRRGAQERAHSLQHASTHVNTHIHTLLSTRTYTHPCHYAHKHTSPYVHIQPAFRPTRTHTHGYILLHICRFSQTRTPTHARTCTHAHARMHARMHACTHKRTHAHKHKYLLHIGVVLGTALDKRKELKERKKNTSSTLVLYLALLSINGTPHSSASRCPSSAAT